MGCDALLIADDASPLGSEEASSVHHIRVTQITFGGAPRHISAASSAAHWGRTRYVPCRTLSRIEATTAGPIQR